MREFHPDLLILYVPPSCTGKLQPQDVVVQKPLKTGIKVGFNIYQTQRFTLARKETRKAAESPSTGQPPVNFYASLCNFKMSTIKPHTPSWLYAGWKRVADDPGMVIRGWEKCGLMAVFSTDPLARAAAIKDASKASTDPDHRLFPLFPQNDRTSIPGEALKGVTEPAFEPVRETAADEEPADAGTLTAISAILTSADEIDAQSVQVAAFSRPATPMSGDNTGFFAIFKQPAPKRKASAASAAPTAKRQSK